MRRMIVAALAASALSGSAEATTYFVDKTLGSINVIGSIVTDGVTGSVAAADITGYALTFSSQGSSYSLSRANGVIFLNSTFLIATPTALTFDFSRTGTFSLSRDNGHIGQPLTSICIETSGTCYGSPGGPQYSLFIEDRPGVPNAYNLQTQTETLTSQVVLATASVPEPATWALMLGGFGLVGGAMRRRRPKAGMIFG